MKRLARLYQNVNRSGLIAINLNDGDGFRRRGLHQRARHLLGTANGMSIRFEEDDARAMDARPPA